MKKSLPAIVIVLAIIGVVFAVAGSASVAQAAEPHPHIYNAYRCSGVRTTCSNVAAVTLAESGPMPSAR